MSTLQGSVYVAELVSDSDLTSATVSCTVTAPDGTVGQGTVTKIPPATGRDSWVASAPILATQVGTYLVVWAISGPVVGSAQDQFTVVAAEADLVSLPDLKDELNLRSTDTSKDAKLRRWLRAATGVVENVTGPIRSRQAVDWFDGGYPFVVLSDRWVSSIVSVVENTNGTDVTLSEQPLGFTVNSYGYTWDRETNVVSRRSSFGAPSRFAGGIANVRVNYVAGLTTIPDDIQLATVELIRHWYAKNEVAYRTGGSGGAFGQAAGDDMGMMVGNYMVPNAVMELLTPWRRLPGMA